VARNAHTMHAQRRQQQRTRRGSGRKHGHGKSTVGRATGVSASQGVATKAAVAAAAAAAASATPDSDGGGEDVRERTERLYQSFRRSSFPEVSEMTASQLFERLQARQLERLLTLQQQQLFNTTAKSVATTAASASTAAATEGQELQGSPLPIRTDHRSGGVTTSSKSNPSSGSAWQLHESGGTNSLVVVDIRTRGEQQVSMLPGAITQVHFETHLSDLLHLSHNQPCARKRTSCSSSAEARVDDEESARASTPTTAGEILPDVKRPIHRVTVVAYCTIGMRSGVYIKVHDQQGTTAVSARVRCAVPLCFKPGNLLALRPDLRNSGRCLAGPPGATSENARRPSDKQQREHGEV